MSGDAVSDESHSGNNWDVRNVVNNAKVNFRSGLEATQGKGRGFYKEVQAECFQAFEVHEVLSYMKNNWHTWFHIPFFPAFHRPGWLTRYAVGPHSPALFEMFFSDVWAGITVALTLIPQGLSYAALANLPPVAGLYSATLPSAIYVLFGSSNQLAVGPVALVSLLMGTLVLQYNIDTHNTEECIDFASECALAVGVILMAMSVLNLGNFIRFISHPVMSGFTTAAAMLIGLNQLKSAFGFINIVVPQQGQVGYEYNYQVLKWFLDNWNAYDPKTVGPGKTPSIARNHYATEICFGLYVPLMLIVILKNNLRSTPARAKTYWFRIWTITSALAPFVAIIIGAHVAYEIHKKDHFNSKTYTHSYYAKNLKIVGLVPPGLDILRVPSMKWDFSLLLGDVFAMTMIAFMESYSVAHRIANQKNELHLLNASQELWAIGCSNIMASLCSGYPVAGSFSRTSLNAAAGARTPLSKTTTMAVILIALKFLTRTFQYIPSAALAAVIFVAVFNLISISDFWHAWKHSKKDFFTMLVTATIVFVFDTSIGLAVGIACSFLVFLSDVAFNKSNAPELIVLKENNEGIDVIKLNGDLNFLTVGRFKDFFTSRILVEAAKPDSNSTMSDRIFYRITTSFDYVLSPRLFNGVSSLPKAVVLDMSFVRVLDLTGLEEIAECARDARHKGIKFVAYNIHCDEVYQSMNKFGIKNNRSTEDINLDPYLALSTLSLLAPEDVMPVKLADGITDSEMSLNPNGKGYVAARTVDALEPSTGSGPKLRTNSTGSNHNFEMVNIPSSKVSEV